MKKFIALFLVFTMFAFVSCEVAYSSNLNALQKWTDQYISTYYDLFHKYVGKTNAELIADEQGYKDMVAKQNELADEPFTYNTMKKMSDVAQQHSFVKGDTAYFYVYTPIPDDDKDIAETKAEVKGDHYYMIGLIIIKAGSDIQSTPDEKLVIKSVEKKVYISSQLPSEQ